jgi:hypothetical protein
LSPHCPPLSHAVRTRPMMFNTVRHCPKQAPLLRDLKVHPDPYRVLLDSGKLMVCSNDQTTIDAYNCTCFKPTMCICFRRMDHDRVHHLSGKRLFPELRKLLRRGQCMVTRTRRRLEYICTPSLLLYVCDLNYCNRFECCFPVNLSQPYTSI